MPSLNVFCESLFCQALARRNAGRPPIWFMRQAGRYLPSYQALRKCHTLSELFFTPQLAKEITLQPIRELGVDAAILFSDITVIAKALGQKLEFVEGVGPVVTPLLEREEQIRPMPAREALSAVGETIDLLRQELVVPLIGFCGGPFTVGHYLLAPEARCNCKLLQHITDVTLDYLDLQIKAGVEAIQIFDSWAHLLSCEQMQQFCFPYHEQLIRKIQSHGLPAISFFRSATQYPQEIAQLGPDAISFDAGRPLHEMRKVVPQLTLQGNLDPSLFFLSYDQIAETTYALLDSMRGDPAFIVNLAHGIKPNTPWQAVRHLVSLVQRAQH
jgi:uroporphyrinogen decarboxylase